MHDRDKLTLIALRTSPRGVTNSELRRKLHHYGRWLHNNDLFDAVDAAIGRGHAERKDTRRLVAGMTVRETTYHLTEAGEAALSAMEQKNAPAPGAPKDGR